MSKRMIGVQGKHFFNIFLRQLKVQAVHAVNAHGGIFHHVGGEFDFRARGHRPRRGKQHRG